LRHLLLAGAGALLLVAAGVLAFRAWYGQTPPPATSSGPGVARLSAPCCPGAPAGPYEVKLADGSTARLTLADAAREQGRPAARIAVALPSDGSRSVDLHEGERGTVGGLTIRVLHIWLTPDPRNRAVDVRVTQS
jgi:hypothetical protein